MGKARVRKAKLRDNAELHDCCNCEGCICEDICREEDKIYFMEEGEQFE